MEIKQTEKGTVTLMFEQQVPATAANLAAAFDSLDAYLRTNVPGDLICTNGYKVDCDAGYLRITVTLESPLRQGWPGNLNI